MIATLSEIKTLLGITTSASDTRINAYIPTIEQDICEICNNDFLDITNTSYIGKHLTVYTYKSTLSFSSTDNSINDSESKFLDNNFKIGDSVRIYFTKHNNQIFTIKTVVAGKVVFEDIDTVVTETSSSQSSFMMVRLAWPRPLKKIVADMIKFCISKNDMSLKSENFGNYSYTNTDKFINGYPENIVQKLYRYRSILKRNIETMNLNLCLK